jgi:hypothetical protein
MMAKTAKVMVSKKLKEERVVIPGRDLWEAATNLHEEWKGHCCASVDEIYGELREAHAKFELPVYQKHGVVKGYRTLSAPERTKLMGERAQEAHKKQQTQRRAERKRPRYAAERRQKQYVAPIPSLA